MFQLLRVCKLQPKSIDLLTLVTIQYKLLVNLHNLAPLYTLLVTNKSIKMEPSRDKGKNL